MLQLFELAIFSFIFKLITITQAADVPPVPRQLDSIGGGEVIRRYPADDVGASESQGLDFTASNVMKTLMLARLLDNIEGENLLDALADTVKSPRSAEGLVNNGALKALLGSVKGTDAFNALERMSNGAILKALDKIDGTEFLLALDRAWHDNNEYRSKRQQTLDSISGMAFGEDKRFGSHSSLAKRNFDEIDNVGFNGFQKRLAFAPGHSTNRIGGKILNLARRNFGGPHRGSSSLAKRNFDEIDRTGFEGFSKRETK